MREWLVGGGLFIGVVWLAAFLLALRDRARSAPPLLFGPEDHVALGIHIRLNPWPRLPWWKRVLSVPLLVLVSPTYLVLLALLLPVVAWQLAAWSCSLVCRGRGRH